MRVLYGCETILKDLRSILAGLSVVSVPDILGWLLRNLEEAKEQQLEKKENMLQSALESLYKTTETENAK